MQDFTPARGMAGIYVIVHRSTGLPYIGSSRKVRDRWNFHRSSLRRGAHSNPRLQTAWDLHGEDAFAFLVVELVSDLTQIQAREQAWLDEVEPHLPGQGYNLRGTSNGTGLVWTPEQCARLSAALLGKPKSPAHRAALGAVWAARSVGERQRRARVGGRSGKGVLKSAGHRRRIGLAQQGGGNHQAKLTEHEVREIRRRLALPESGTYGFKVKIAREFGISGTTVRNIETGSRWGHVT